MAMISPLGAPNLSLRGAICLGVLAVCAVTAARSQSIRIPDFRQTPAIATVKPGDACEDCGRIVSIRETTSELRAVAPAPSQGATRGPAEYNIVGAVIYLPLSKADKPFVGGVGTPEMKERFGQSTYTIAVRMDDGTTRSVQRGDGAQYHAGDRVRLPVGGGLELLAE